MNDADLDNKSLLKTRSPKRFQISIATILLATLSVAIWIRAFQLGDQAGKQDRELKELRNYTRDLVVDDPTQYAAVGRLQTWYDEAITDIHLPPSEEKYWLRLKLDDLKIPHNNTFTKPTPKPQREIELDAGTHKIEIVSKSVKKGFTLKLLVDDVEVIEESRPAGWEPRQGSSGGHRLSTPDQFSTDEPLLIFNRRYSQLPGKKSKTGPGIMVWIEAEDSSDEDSPAKSP